MVKGTSLIGLAGTLILTGVALKTLEQIDTTTKRKKRNPNKFKVPNIKLVRNYGKVTKL
ncbi:hypothetical protein LCGC14_0651950 [marine sediment metagenome]|uniref:Uncharacterized protein n=1 Tax=marine sediment metagenome TaxID=412755 RepID=A0A0F9RFU1_9ZZZZ